MDSLLISVLFLMFFFSVLMSIRFIVRKNFITFIVLLSQVILFIFLGLNLIKRVPVVPYLRIPAQIIGITVPFMIIINDLKNRNREVGYLHILDFLHDIFSFKKHESIEHISKNNIKVPNSIYNIVNIRNLKFKEIDEKTDVYKRIHQLLVHCQTKVNKGLYKDVYNTYNYCSKIFLNNPVITYNYGCICFHLELYSEAVKMFSKTLENIKKYNKINETKEEIYRLEEVEKVSIDDILYNESVVKYNLAVSRHAAGRFKECINDYQSILDEMPDHKITIENLASAAINSGDNRI